jgi:hypothetical protein
MTGFVKISTRSSLKELSDSYMSAHRFPLLYGFAISKSRSFRESLSPRFAEQLNLTSSLGHCRNVESRMAGFVNAMAILSSTSLSI